MGLGLLSTSKLSCPKVVGKRLSPHLWRGTRASWTGAPWGCRGAEAGTWGSLDWTTWKVFSKSLCTPEGPGIEARSPGVMSRRGRLLLTWSWSLAGGDKTNSSEMSEVLGKMWEWGSFVNEARFPPLPLSSLAYSLSGSSKTAQCHDSRSWHSP